MPSAIEVAQHVGIGNPSIGQEDLVETRVAGGLPQWSHLDAGLFHGYEEECHAAVLRL